MDTPFSLGLIHARERELEQTVRRLRHRVRELEAARTWHCPVCDLPPEQHDCHALEEQLREDLRRGCG